MKSFFKLSVVVTCFSEMAFAAGPVINSTDLAPVGTVFGVYSAQSSGKVDPGPAGQNQTWDFSSLSVTAFATYEVINSSSVPSDIAAALPSANRWEKVNTGPNQSAYNAYQLTSSFYDFLAIGAHGNATSGIKYTRLYTISMTSMRFPFSFGNIINDSAQFSGVPTYTYTQEYDAYGTLKTPKGTYNNVIRVKTVASGGHVSYSWCTSSPYGSLMTINDSTDVTFYTMQSSSSVSPHVRPVLHQTNFYLQNAKQFDLLGKTHDIGHVAKLPEGIFINYYGRNSTKLQIMK